MNVQEAIRKELAALECMLAQTQERLVVLKMALGLTSKLVMPDVDLSNTQIRTFLDAAAMICNGKREEFADSFAYEKAIFFADYLNGCFRPAERTKSLASI